MYNSKLHILFIVLVLFGAINMGFVALLDKDLIKMLNDVTFKNDSFVKSVYIIIAVSGLFLAIQKDTYFPSISQTVFPPSALKPYHTYDTQSVKINASGGSKVVYWAADPGTDVSSTIEGGYNNYENSGIVPVDNDGTATLYFKCPKQYKANGIWVMPKHIHYRIAYTNGTLSDVMTVNINC